MDQTSIIKVWAANVAAVFLNLWLSAQEVLFNIPAEVAFANLAWLQPLKDILSVAAILLSMSYTLWQWHRNKKGGK